MQMFTEELCLFCFVEQQIKTYSRLITKKFVLLN